MSIQAFQYPLFVQPMRIVTEISNSNPMSVTTSFAHGYLTGLNNRLYIPQGFGMPEANLLTAYITVTSPTTFTMDGIDSTNFLPFSVPAGNLQYSQTVNIGENTLMLNGSWHNQYPLGNTYFP